MTFSQETLTTRKLGHLDDAGIERQTILTVYMPFHGATVVTSNRRDFELLRAEVGMNLLVL